MPSKYDVDPLRLQGKKDIVEYFKELDNRVGDSETGLRIGNTAIENGNLTIRNGDIIVSETAGLVVLRVIHGAVPEIRFFPIGDTTDHRATIFGQGSSPPFPTTTLTFAIETNPAGAIDGGKLIIDQSFTVLSHQPASGNESYFWLNIDAVASEVFAFQGKVTNQVQYSTLQAIYPGTQSVSAGVSSYTHTYFAAFATTAAPVATLNNTGGGTVSWNLTAQSTSAFTITWSGTTAKVINWWVFRV